MKNESGQGGIVFWRTQDMVDDFKFWAHKGAAIGQIIRTSDDGNAVKASVHVVGNLVGASPIAENTSIGNSQSNGRIEKA